ncbi:MAG: hypothetical protein K6F32_00025, partial [Bacilli bacterium]|nr:hypothetical protein [Bacilli bacterium]
MAIMDIVFWIMTGLIGLIGLLLVFLLSWQFLFIFFAPLKPRHFKENEDLKRFAIIIPAHNESSVIKESVTFLLNELDYPKQRYDVYVCADNCS